MKLDIHSIIHFVGSYALAMTFSAWGVPMYWLIAFGLGILWEFFDYVNSQMALPISWLDRRGADWVDITVDGLGVALAVVVLNL